MMWPPASPLVSSSPPSPSPSSSSGSGVALQCTGEEVYKDDVQLIYEVIVMLHESGSEGGSHTVGN